MIRTALGVVALMSLIPATHAQDISADEARAIAKEAYIYGFPPVDSYRILYSYFVDESSPEYKGPWNEIHHNARVFTPADTAMQTPNSDTPYSQLGLDLRTEPMVLSVPEVEEGRYYTVEVNDLYTFITDYVGSRTTGNDAGNFLIVGPVLAGRDASRHREGDPFGDGALVPLLPDAAVPPRGHRERQESAGRLQDTAAVLIPR